MEDKDRVEILNAIENYYVNHIKSKKRESVPVSGKKFDHTEIINIVDAALDCWWTEGRFSDELSDKLKEFLGIRFVSLVNSGSSANLLTLSCLTSNKLGVRRLKEGDEVITVATGFPTTINPIIQNGLVPVFCDIDIETHNININDLKESLSDKSKAVMIAHTLGNPFNIKEVKAFCEANNLWLIEDCCDALGSKYGGKYVSTFGDLATFSFYPAHHITTGEGGAVATNNPLLYKLVNSFRDWGRDCWCRTGMDDTCKMRYSQQFGNLPFGYDHKYVYSEIGYNLKLTDLQAAIGCAQMDKIEDFMRRRKENYENLKTGLKRYEDFFMFPKVEENSDPSWFGFIITLRDGCGFNREELLQFLGEKKIASRLIFSGNILKQPCFSNNEIKHRIVGELINSDKSMRDSFWVGVSPLLDKSHTDRICNTIGDFLKGRSNKNVSE